jgi:hypothetical protein
MNPTVAIQNENAIEKNKMTNSAKSTTVPAVLIPRADSTK